MLEIATTRKNKISLSDYNYENDIENRALLSEMSEFELNILEEILFSSIKTSKRHLINDLNIQESVLLPVLQKLEKTNLLKFEGEIIIIDKKMRKYFEFEYLRFDENFKPDLQFINHLLHKIPIHVLPIWYSIPKSSNNIFKSIIDKFLLSPGIFQRYLEDLEHESQMFFAIINDLYNSDNYELKIKDLEKKYCMDRRKCLENLILLEFNFICFQSYKKTDEGFEEIITPFYEYREYLQYLKKSKTPCINNTSKLIKKRNSDFGFVEDLTSILQMSLKKLSFSQIKDNIKKELHIKDPNIIVSSIYIESLISKLKQLKFITKKKDVIEITQTGKKWADLNIENRALHLYYHPLNTFDDDIFPNELKTEKATREAEKSISRVIDAGWVYFDDFIKGLIAPITEEHQIKIKSFGKTYKYSTPSYSKNEIKLVKKSIFEKLFESGMVSIGSLNGKDCFCVTNFGKTLFETS